MSKPPAALTREGRDKCWTARDAFFQCLNANKADRPPEYLKDGEGPCAIERKEYEKDCPRSWVEYFNKRRVLEIRQRLTIEAAERERAAIEASKSGRR